jgi:hypothetical protein
MSRERCRKDGQTGSCSERRHTVSLFQALSQRGGTHGIHLHMYCVCVSLGRGAKPHRNTNIFFVCLFVCLSFNPLNTKDTDRIKDRGVQ